MSVKFSGIGSHWLSWVTIEKLTGLRYRNFVGLLFYTKTKLE